MNNKERVIDEETDLYEEILTYESLDQYEGLLNHYRNNKKAKKIVNNLIREHEDKFGSFEEPVIAGKGFG